MKLKKIQNKEEFKSVISQEKSIIMIHKTQCPFCEKAMPWMEDHAKENSHLTIAEVNEKDIREVLEIFQVKMYPTFVAFQEGKVIETFFGDTQFEKVKDFVLKNI